MITDSLRLLGHYLLPKRFLTTLAGQAASMTTPWFKNSLIRAFARHFKVNLQEAVHETPEEYATFNDFFIRSLKPGVRPLEAGSIICPVDGTISAIGEIKNQQIFQAKGRTYTLEELLTPHVATAPFKNGLFTTLYLAPKDYHRIHMPIQGTLVSTTYIPGKLFSVQPFTAKHIPKLFARNERLVCLFDTRFGPLAMVMVGATIVGSMTTTWGGTVPRSNKILHQVNPEKSSVILAQGDEMGYFSLGSTVIMLLPPQTNMHWRHSLKKDQSVRLGEILIP
ncbi:MAG: archaetidylserine decarboxylase [Legionellaceae bacterium]|nr:archaetidylserine decarboxylase [Legionellaceae bacterium]